MDSAMNRINNDQNGYQSVGSVPGQINAMGNPPQQPLQMAGLPGNNNGGNTALTLALFGDLAKAAGLGDLQALLGNNNNNSSGQGGSNGGHSGSIEQQLRALGLLPMQQQQSSARSFGPSAASLSQAGATSSSGEEENSSGRFSFSQGERMATAVSVLSGNKAKKSNRIVVVPCRARGMSMEHNFQTAFFEIHENIKHGDGLICSFPECRNRGVKFLYCAYCKDPVAKRNFRNRHTHEQEASKDRSSKQKASQSKMPATTANASMRTNDKKNPQEISEGTGSSNTLSGSSSGVLAVAPRHHHQKDAKKRSGSNLDDEGPKNKLSRMPNSRKEAWELLLAERPSTDESYAMSAWLMKVMAVSDTKKPVAQALAQVMKAAPTSKSPATLSMEQGSSGSSNEDSNESSPTEESFPASGSAPTESSSNGDVKNAHAVKKMPSSKPMSSNDGSNEDSSPTNGSSNESSNDSSSDNQDDMDIKEIWIRD